MVQRSSKRSFACGLAKLRFGLLGLTPLPLQHYQISQAMVHLKDQLTADQLLLVNQWVAAYKKIPEPVLKKIKQEVNMELVETTISEHVYNRGLAKGKAEGHLEGQLTVLENLHRQGLLSKAQRNAMVAPLRQQLRKLKNSAV